MNKETGQITVIPGREDFYERLLEAEKLLAAKAKNTEDATINHALFYQEVSEAELARQFGIARTILQ